MDRRTGNDVSSFFLFEASGDSEGDPNYLGDYSELHLHNFFAMCHGISLAREDDAESCSCDSSYMLGVDEIDQPDDQDFGDSDDDHDHNKLHHLQKQGWTHPVIGLSGVALGFMPMDKEGEKASRAAGEGGSEVAIEEMERNRLFWETCLELGYP